MVTGSHGFVGGSVGRFAARLGHQVLGVGLASQPASDWPGAYQQADVSYSDLSTVIEAFKPAALLHAAGTASVSASLSAPLDDLRAAVLTFANVLDCVRRSTWRPLVLFPSSAAVYGNPADLPVGENAQVAPISPYGFHKAACELLAREYASCFDLSVVVARLFSVYGPRQRRLLLWELYTQAVSSASEIVLQGTGTETRDYSHVDDIAAIFLALAEAAPTGCPVINVASGIELPIGDLAKLVLASVGVEKRVRSLGQAQPGNPMRWVADVRRLDTFGVPAQRSLSVGIDDCVRAWRCV